MDDRFIFLKSYIIWAHVEQYFKKRALYNDTTDYPHVLDIKVDIIEKKLNMLDEKFACPICTKYYNDDYDECDEDNDDCNDCVMYFGWPTADGFRVKNCYDYKSIYKEVEDRKVKASVAAEYAGNLTSLFWNEYKKRELKS